MYGRADGMPSFQLTVAVRIQSLIEAQYTHDLLIDDTKPVKMRHQILFAIACPRATMTESRIDDSMSKQREWGKKQNRNVFINNHHRVCFVPFTNPRLPLIAKTKNWSEDSKA